MQPNDPRKPIIRQALKREFEENKKTWSLNIDEDRYLSIFALVHHNKLYEKLKERIKGEQDEFPLLVAFLLKQEHGAAAAASLSSGIAPTTIMTGGHPTIVAQATPTPA